MVILREINGQLLLLTGSTAKSQPLTKNATQNILLCFIILQNHITQQKTAFSFLMTAQSSFLRISYTVSFPNNTDTRWQEAKLNKTNSNANNQMMGQNQVLVKYGEWQKKPQLHKDPFFVPSFTLSFTSIHTLTYYCHFCMGILTPQHDISRSRSWGKKPIKKLNHH